MSPLGGTPGPAHQVQLTPAGPNALDEPTWHGTLPGCPPGSYDITVEVQGVSGHGSVFGAATVVTLASTADEDEGGAK